MLLNVNEKLKTKGEKSMIENKITVFTNSEFGRVRIFDIANEPWFVLIDICKILDITRGTKVVSRLDEDEVRQTSLADSMGRQQNTYIVNESGLYNVILRSDKPQAKSFRKWITSEVLPALRKVGSYSLQNPSNNTIPIEVLENLIRSTIAEQLNPLISQIQILTVNFNSDGKQFIKETVESKQSTIEYHDLYPTLTNIITPLAKAYKDNSKGYNATYRKVYIRMGCDFQRIGSRYRNVHNLKNRPSNRKLISERADLQKRFIKAVSQLLNEIEEGK